MGDESKNQKEKNMADVTSKEAQLISLLALAGFIYQFIMFYVQHQPYASDYGHAFNITYLLVTFCFFIRNKSIGLVLVLAYFIIFNHYSSDPYSNEFDSYYEGIYKYIILLMYVGFSKKIKTASLIMFALLFTLGVVGAVRNFGNITYILSDIVFYCFIAVSVFKAPYNSYVLTSWFIYRYVSFLPIGYAFLYFNSLYYMESGSIYFLYGHVYGVVSVLALLYWKRFSGKYDLAFFGILLNFVIYIQSAQTEHYLIMIFSLILSALMAKRRIVFYTYAGLLLAIVISLCFAYYISADGSWVKLKTGQLVQLVTLESSVYGINSLGVRVCSLISIVNSFDILESFIGSGFGSTYPLGQCFERVTLHENSFPEREILAGELHFVHSTPVKVYLQTGVIGLVLFVIYFIAGMNRKFNLDGIYIFMCVVLLAMSNTQFSPFIIMMYIYYISQSGMLFK